MWYVQKKHCDCTKSFWQRPVAVAVWLNVSCGGHKTKICAGVDDIHTWSFSAVFKVLFQTICLVTPWDHCHKTNYSFTKSDLCATHHNSSDKTLVVPCGVNSPMCSCSKCLPPSVHQCVYSLRSYTLTKTYIKILWENPSSLLYWFAPLDGVESYCSCPQSLNMKRKRTHKHKWLVIQSSVVHLVDATGLAAHTLLPLGVDRWNDFLKMLIFLYNKKSSIF